MTTSSPLRVIKIGGSLLALNDLPVRLEQWLAAQSSAINVLLLGGGPLADAVRDWDQRFHLGDEAAHWLCVDLLDTTADLLCQLLPHAERASDWRKLRDGSATIVFAPATFLKRDEPQLPGQKLPRSWGVTSDSIAARLAEVLAADELVLLKSTDPGDADYVDGHFARASRGVKSVRYVNLRAE